LGGLSAQLVAIDEIAQARDVMPSAANSLAA